MVDSLPMARNSTLIRKKYNRPTGLSGEERLYELLIVHCKSWDERKEANLQYFTMQPVEKGNN